jgi:hypothetical protein
LIIFIEKVYFVICNALQLYFSNSEDIDVDSPGFFLPAALNLKKTLFPACCLLPNFMCCLVPKSLIGLVFLPGECLFPRQFCLWHETGW